MSVKRRSLREHEVVDRYRLNRSKTFVDRLQTAKREKEDLKIKSVDSSTAYNRLTYIVANIRKKSNHKVDFGKSPFCDRQDFMKNSGKEFWKHIRWTLRYLIFVDCRKTVICCSSYASVNSSCAQRPPTPPPPPPHGLTSGISIFCLGWQIPGGGDSWAVKSPGVRTKKEGKCPVLRQLCNIFQWSHSRVVPF